MFPHGTQCLPHGTQCLPHGTQCLPHSSEHPHGTAHTPHGTAHMLYRVDLCCFPNKEQNKIHLDAKIHNDAV